MVVLKEEYTQWHALADMLSLITISTCFILKIPQIINIVRVKNADGISMLGLLMELSSYTVMFSYNYRNGYNLLSYMEYPIILVQELFLVYFVMYYKRLLGIKSLFFACVYFAIAGGFLGGIISREFLTYLAPLCTPIGASSKVVQLVEIFRTKNSECISLLTWFISAFTNFTRIYTVYIDSKDATLLLNFTVNVLLSSSIMLSAYYYKPRKIKEE